MYFFREEGNEIFPSGIGTIREAEINQPGREEARSRDPTAWNDYTRAPEHAAVCFLR